MNIMNNCLLIIKDKVRDIHKMEKIIPLAIVFLFMKIRKNIQSMYQKNIAKEPMLIDY